MGDDIKRQMEADAARKRGKGMEQDYAPQVGGSLPGGPPAGAAYPAHGGMGSDLGGGAPHHMAPPVMAYGAGAVPQRPVAAYGSPQRQQPPAPGGAVIPGLG